MVTPGINTKKAFFENAKDPAFIWDEWVNSGIQTLSMYQCEILRSTFVSLNVSFCDRQVLVLGSDFIACLLYILSHGNMALFYLLSAC